MSCCLVINVIQSKYYILCNPFIIYWFLYCISFIMSACMFHLCDEGSPLSQAFMDSVIHHSVSSEQLEKMKLDEGSSCSSDRILRVTHMSPTGEKQQWALYLCYHACILDYSWRGQPHNEHLYRQRGWMTGPHRLIMQACNYWTCCQILKGNLGIKCLTAHLYRNVTLPRSFQQKWQPKHMD